MSEKTFPATEPVPTERQRLMAAAIELPPKVGLEANCKAVTVPRAIYRQLQLPFEAPKAPRKASFSPQELGDAERGTKDICPELHHLPNVFSRYICGMAGNAQREFTFSPTPAPAKSGASRHPGRSNHPSTGMPWPRSLGSSEGRSSAKSTSGKQQHPLHSSPLQDAQVSSVARSSGHEKLSSSQ